MHKSRCLSGDSLTCINPLWNECMNTFLTRVGWNCLCVFTAFSATELRADSSLRWQRTCFGMKWWWDKLLPSCLSTLPELSLIWTRLNHSGLCTTPEDMELFLYKTWRDWFEFPQDLVSSSSCFLKANQPSLKCFPPMLSHLSCINDTFSSKIFCLNDLWYNKDIVSSLSSHLSVHSLPKSFGISVGNHQNITSMFLPWHWGVKSRGDVCVLKLWREKGKSKQCRNSSCWQQNCAFLDRNSFLAIYSGAFYSLGRLKEEASAPC